MSRRYLVIGGGGFIGSHLCEALLARGDAVRVLEIPHLERFAVSKGASLEWIEGDFCNVADISKCLDGCDVVFHLASTTLPKSGNDDPLFDIRTNVVGSVALIQSACSKRVKKIVFASSGGTVYGIPQTTPITEDHPTDPISSYGITKLAIEKYLAMFHRSMGLDFGIARLANPYGPRQRPQAAQGAVTTFIHRALRNEAIEIWGDGTVVRDYVYIEDVAQALVAIADWPGRSGIFNVGSGTGTSLNQVVQVIENAVGHGLDVRYLHGRSFDVPANVLDIRHIATELGWSPRYTLEAGVRETIEVLKRKV